jgi:hypothetical protein
MVDVVAILSAIAIQAAPLVIVAIIAFLFGRWVEKRDRTEEEDRRRVYEPLHAQVRKLVLSEDSAKRGFSLSTPDTEVLDGIVNHGAFVQPRHRRLKADVERLRALVSAYKQRAWDFNMAANAAFKVEGEKVKLDDIKSDSALYNAVVGLSQEAFVKRVDEIVRGKPGSSADGKEMFRAVTVVTEAARESLQQATDALLAHGRAMQAALEHAFRRGTYGRRLGWPGRGR